MHWLKQNDQPAPVRVGAFRCEESSNFGIATLGSSLVTGHHKDMDLSRLTSRDNAVLGDIFKD
jgi:N-carbamoyl-L-amino-acid hydrolase